MAQSILFVCMGNICRSPAAEAVFLHKISLLDMQDKFVVDSAGTGGWHVGGLADPRMRSAASRRGISVESIARQITVEDLRSFDKILTMDQQNYQSLISLANESGISIDNRIQPMLSYAKGVNIKDVPDPYYGGEEGFESVLDLLEDACDGLIDDLLHI